VERFDKVVMFCDVLTVTAFVAPEYERPVEKVVVAELNLEKSEAARHPKVVLFAVVQVRADAEEPMTEIGCESESAPDAVKDVVATVASFAGEVAVPKVDQYASCPRDGVLDVPTCPYNVPEDVIVPPKSPSPAVRDVTVPAFCARQVVPIA
jgi:hypothetical protein